MLVARRRSRRAAPLNLPKPSAPLALAALLWLALVAAAIVLFGEDGDPDRPRIAPLPPKSCPGPEVGVHSTLAFDGDAERRARTVDAIDEVLGAQVVRDSLLWHQIEQIEGERDWSRSDSVVEELRAAGIEPVLVVIGSPSWANGVPESTPRHFVNVPPRGPTLDAWIKQYADFLAEAVSRYRGAVRRWEIWNEPNLTLFWRPRPDPDAYRQVYERLRATILRVDPNAEVAVGGLASLVAEPPEPSIPGLAFLGRLTRTQPPLDNVAIHPYTTDDHPPAVHVPGQNNFDDIGRVHDQLVAEGERASIWVTEWGWSSATVGERRQAQYVDRSLAMLEARYPFVRVATHFADRDRPPEFFQGLLASDLQPKPAALAFRRHADLVASRC